MSPLVFDAEAKETFAVCISDELEMLSRKTSSLSTQEHVQIVKKKGKLAGKQQALIRCEDSRALIVSLIRQFFHLPSTILNGIE